MELTRRSLFVYGVLAAVWVLVAAWQGEEHLRVRQAAKSDLSNRSKDIANTVSACLRGMRFRGTVLEERLEPVLNELVNGRSNELVKASELVSIALLNATGERIASAGRPIDFRQGDILQRGERWGTRSVSFINPVDLGSSMVSEGATNPIVVLPRMTNSFPDPERTRSFSARRGPESEPPPPGDRPPPDQPDDLTNKRAALASTNPPPRPPREGRSRDGGFRIRRPPWLRDMSESEFQALIEKHELHGLAVALSTDSFRAVITRDLWLRSFIVFLATLSAIGAGLAWSNLATSSDLQIRLVRASELNTHLKEMNLAAAGLAHETRNPLNIIRGLAQMISKQPEIAPEVRQKSREIVDEADKVAAQLNEFINYSRPREVRRTIISLGSVVGEVVRTLNYDLDGKQVHLEARGEPIQIEADEQLLRQALFNLLLNAIHAVHSGGEIQVVMERQNAAEAVLEVRDNGPGVPPERRAEIFKPYFTTQETGTGLGLAVVQQIVLAHGWEIQCLANQPKGAVFRITHLKIGAG